MLPFFLFHYIDAIDKTRMITLTYHNLFVSQKLLFSDLFFPSFFFFSGKSYPFELYRARTASVLHIILTSTKSLRGAQVKLP